MMSALPAIAGGGEAAGSTPVGGHLSGSQKKQGENMLDTIDLLAAIGQDASLRHATPEQLLHALEELADAPPALMAAAAAGSVAPLSEAFGHAPLHLIHHSQTPGHEEEQDEDEEPEQKHPELKSLPHD
jgi:hypothetical protein